MARKIALRMCQGPIRLASYRAEDLRSGSWEDSFARYLSFRAPSRVVV